MSSPSWVVPAINIRSPKRTGFRPPKGFRVPDDIDIVPPPTFQTPFRIPDDIAFQAPREKIALEKMASLKHHQRSLIDHLNESFQELAKESDKNHAQIQELEKENRILKEKQKVDASRIRDFLSEISRLQSTKESANEEEEQEALEQKLQSLERTYGPQKVAEESGRDAQDLKFNKAPQGTDFRYNALYRETVTLIQVSQSLRNQVKRYKERATQWQRWAKLSPNLDTHDGKKVSRDDNTRRIRSDEQSSHADHSHPIADPDDARLNASRELFRSPLASTPLSARFRVPSAAANESNLDFTVPHPSSTASNSSVHEEEIEERVEGGGESTARIKDEPISPGSLQGSSPTGQGMQPSGSQDLDEVGDTVVTPRSRKFAVFEDEMYRPQQNEQVNRSLQKGERRVFQPKDTNQTNHFIMPRESAFKRRRTGDSGASKISSVSEDGDEDYLRKNARNENETPCKGSSRDPEAHRRLDDLLEVRPQKHNFALGPSLGRTPGSTTSASRRGYTPRTLSAAAHETTTTPSGGVNRTIEEWMKPTSGRFAPKTKGRFSHESNTGREDWNAIVQSVPYRELPVDCLDVSCFKPNPARNHGIDYAFNEVVRNHEQRKCLPGCMRADCCGEKFRAMVRAGGVKYEEETHRALLEDFLGDQKHTLGQLSEDERRTLLVEAKARELANQFGKHRHVYERPRSPPGFWRTDMPSTQELAKDRIEADRIEREKVLDRVREAMRPNGLWKFADEM